MRDAPCRSGARTLFLAVCFAALHSEAPVRAQTGPDAVDLPFPGELEKQARVAGNPLATYATMLALDEEYRASRVFAGIYPEVRLNYEEFLGLPFAGVEAMSLPAFRGEPSRGETPIPSGFEPRDAVEVIVEMAKTTRLVVYGEEHHLPQTRSIYEPLLRRLWELGYRYLAAEAFSDEVMASDFTVPRYTSGYYLMDPVFAAAIRTARRLGYRLIAYDTTERGPPDDGSFRDRTQAANIRRRIFESDPEARVLVIAGRGHAAEVPPADGWTPMASVLAELTGIDPFTVYAPTMSERSTESEEDPMYRFALAKGLVQLPTIFVHEDGSTLGSGSCDAYVFWPRTTLVEGRPDWLVTTLGRKAAPVPEGAAKVTGLRLVQAFFRREPERAVPVDQVLLRDGEASPALMLPAGEFTIRVLDEKGVVAGPFELRVDG